MDFLTYICRNWQDKFNMQVFHCCADKMFDIVFKWRIFLMLLAGSVRHLGRWLRAFCMPSWQLVSEVSSIFLQRLHYFVWTSCCNGYVRLRLPHSTTVLFFWLNHFLISTSPLFSLVRPLTLKSFFADFEKSDLFFGQWAPHDLHKTRPDV